MISNYQNRLHNVVLSLFCIGCSLDFFGICAKLYWYAGLDFHFHFKLSNFNMYSGCWCRKLFCFSH